MNKESTYVYAVIYFDQKTHKYQGLPTLFARKEDAERDRDEQTAMGREGFGVVELEVY